MSAETARIQPDEASMPDKRCRLRWSTQHWPAVYSREFRSLRFFWGVDSSAARPGRVALGMDRQVSSLREVLPQQEIRVFVRAALPGTLWITEVDLHIRRYGEVFVLGHL
jgi:hypothetical protein